MEEFVGDETIGWWDMALALSLGGYCLSQLGSWPSVSAAINSHRRLLLSSSDAGKAEGERMTAGGGGLKKLRHQEISPNFTCGPITSSILGFHRRLQVSHEMEYGLAEFDELVQEEFGFTGKELDKSKTPLDLEKEVSDIKKVIVELKNYVHARPEKEKKLEFDGLKEQEAVMRELENNMKITDMEMLDIKQEIAELRSSVQTLNERKKIVEFDGLKDQEAVIREIKNSLKIADMEGIGIKQEIAELRSSVQALQERENTVEFDSFKDQAVVVKELENNMKIAYLEVLDMNQKILELTMQEREKNLDLNSLKEQVVVMRELDHGTKIADMKQEIDELRNSIQTLHEREKELDFNNLKEQEKVMKDLENHMKIADVEALDMKQEITELRNFVQTLQEREKKLDFDSLREQETVIRELTNHVKIADEEALGMKKEILDLRNSVQTTLERERKIEIQLLESNNLKEQQAITKELEVSTKIASLEAQFFTEMESLRSDNKHLEAQLSSYSKRSAELDAAGEKIKLLKRRLWSNSGQAKEKIASLKKKIVALQHDKGTMLKHVRDVEGDHDKLKDLEDEVVDLRRKNSRLEQENVDLAKKLESTEMLVSIKSGSPEGNDAVEEAGQLRQTNDELLKKIDQLQTDQCSDLQQQVYLRWINACLRYELRNHQPAPGKLAARDLNMSLSPRSAEKAKELIFDYAYSDNDEESLSDMDIENWFSSQSSSQVEIEIEEPDDAISTARDNNHSSSKPKFLSRLKNLVLIKEAKKENKRISSSEVTPRQSSYSARMASALNSSPGNVTARNSYESTDSGITIDHARGKQFTSIDARSDRMLHKNMNREAAKITGGGRCKSDLGSLGGYKRFISNETTWKGSPEVAQFCNGKAETPEKTQLKKYASSLKSSSSVLLP